MKQLTLEKWGEKVFDPAPSVRTMRKWARTGKIQPEPMKIGRTWRVLECAEYVEPEPENETYSDDTVVNDIINQL